MRVITTVEGLDTLPRMSVVGCISYTLNLPLVAVFKFLLVNQLPFELTVLWEPES